MAFILYWFLLFVSFISSWNPSQDSPETPVNHALVGYQHQLRQEYDEALKEYALALDDAPNYPDVYWNMALIYSQRNQFQLAIDSYRKLLRLTPSDTDVLYNLGFALDKIGESEEAIKVYDKILEIDAGDIHAPIGKGVALSHSGKIDEAIIELKKALESNPKYANYNLACMYSKKGDGELALQYFKTAILYMDEKLIHWARTDPDLESLRELPEFEEILERRK